MKKTLGFLIGVVISLSVYGKNVKDAEFSGSFYPADKNALSSMIDDFFSKAEVLSIDGTILGVIAPHAGYIYSGLVAAHSYKILRDEKYDTVVILGTSHQHRFNGVAVYDEGVFKTPLGTLAVDKSTAESFSSLPFVQLNKDYFDNEHSLEVQLPFILKTLGKVKIVPILFGEVTYGDLEAVSDKFNQISKVKRVLIIVSTDLSHYLSYSAAVKKDSQTIAFIENKDFSSLWDSWVLAQGRGCGICPLIAFLMYTAEKNAEIKVIKYANSGDVTGDKNRVVGYVSAVAVQGRGQDLPTAQKEAGMAGEYRLSGEDRRVLLKEARSALESFLKDGKKPEQISTDSASLKAERGAFVTLHKNGQLRGCIGTMEPDIPLCKVVPQFAIYSAVQDIRFKPVTYDELKDIEIEISVLTPPLNLEADSWQDLLSKLRPLVDGVVIISKRSSSTYLPQVWEQLPDKEEFLSSLCVKGGLPADYWKTNFKDIKMQTYQAIVFSESQIQL